MEPIFVVSPDTDANVRRRVRFLEDEVQRAPELFLSEMRRLGNIATAGSISTNEIASERQSTLTREPEDLIKEYFTQRYDSDVEFDDDSETAIARNPDHRTLLAAQREKTNVRLQLGTVTSESRAHPEANATRDDVRRSRLELFIGRRIAWQAQQKDDAAQDTLPSAV